MAHQLDQYIVTKNKGAFLWMNSFFVGASVPGICIWWWGELRPAITRRANLFICILLSSGVAGQDLPIERHRSGIFGADLVIEASFSPDNPIHRHVTNRCPEPPGSEPGAPGYQNIRYVFMLYDRPTVRVFLP